MNDPSNMQILNLSPPDGVRIQSHVRIYLLTSQNRQPQHQEIASRQSALDGSAEELKGYHRTSATMLLAQSCWLPGTTLFHGVSSHNLLVSRTMQLCGRISTVALQIGRLGREGAPD